MSDQNTGVRIPSFTGRDGALHHKASVAMSMRTASDAINRVRCLEVRYDGYTRIVEVHACGYTKNNNAVIWVWQLRGGRMSNAPAGWKLLRLDAATGMRILNEVSAAPRPGLSSAAIRPWLGSSGRSSQFPKMDAALERDTPSVRRRAFWDD